VTFALDCCDREAMSRPATTAGHSGDIVRDVMLAAVENRFGSELHTQSEIEWLSDNGSGYTADDTRRFAVAIGLTPLTTPVGMAESFMKTMKRDYVAFMPKPDAATAARNLAIAFEHYNEKHPHSALQYRSPRGFGARWV
jgi:putative transposase